MWQWLMDLLPDWGWKTGFEIIRDCVSVGLAVLGSYLAYLAIQMGKEQSRLGKEQTAIAKRQADIAETQHRIMQEQLLRRTDLRVRATGQRLNWSSDRFGYTQTEITLTVVNRGTKAADGFHWEVFIPEGFYSHVRFLDDMNNVYDGTFAPFSESEIYRKTEDHCTHKLFPKSKLAIVRLRVESDQPITDQFVIKWRIFCEDGAVPTEGLGGIHFRKMSDRMFAVAHPEPGQPFDDSAFVLDDEGESAQS